MSGWIKLHRKTLDNPVVCKDSDHLAVWSYILLNATHKEYPSMFLGKKIMLQPGQLITGRKVIAEKFNISESKVQRILKTFENEQQIEQQNGNKNRLITVLTWSDYQDGEQQIEQQVNNNRTTTEQQVNTYKNVKNLENYSSISVSDNNEPKTAMDAYIFSFKKLQYTGFISNYVMQLLNQGLTDSFIREVFMQMGANGVTSPNVEYMRKIVDDWNLKGISSREEAAKLKEAQKEGGDGGGVRDDKFRGSNQTVKVGGNATTRAGKEQRESKVYPGRWDDTPLSLPNVQG